MLVPAPMTSPARGAIIFDMDGLLVDSEPLWVRAEIEIFGSVGAVLTPDDCAKTKGLRVDDVVAYWQQARGFSGPASAPAEVEARLVARVAELVRHEGVALLGATGPNGAVAIAKATGRPVALASSSPMTIIRATLERLDLVDAFDLVLSAEGLPFGKPHPAIFLEVAQQLGVSPVRCVVLEDSMNGVLAAKSARMTCIAIPERIPGHPADPRFVVADVILGSLEEATAARFEELLA